MVEESARATFLDRPRVTVSGSFHRHLAQIELDVARWSEAGCDVLSPSDARLVDAFGDFVFVASDRIRTLRIVQERHHEAIRQSDALWLVCPDGYVGASAAMEIGLAVGVGVPVFAETVPIDQTLRQHVRAVPSPTNVLRALSGPLTVATESALLDPESAVATAHRHLELIETLLTRSDRRHRSDDPRLTEAAASVRQSLNGL